MPRPVNYKTKQREIILDYIISLSGAHVTIQQIFDHFRDNGVSIGLTTIYRHLDKLVSEGCVKKYLFDGISGASYQYVDTSENNKHYYLKCDKCGDIKDVECDYIDEIKSHVDEEHDFKIDTSRALFYGKCNECE